MKADCHIHMVLDGENWKAAIAAHRNGPDETLIRQRLAAYRDGGFAYLRDGGDRWGVGQTARTLAGEYGIVYRTPLAPLCHAGHYGGFIGEKFENISGYYELVRKNREKGGDFIKIMISGLMDFDHAGILTEEALEEKEIQELIRIAHGEGFAVMAHANGPRTVEAAAEAGVDSVEHGAYLDDAALRAMAENGTIWCPTVSTVANLRGKGRFDEGAVQAIFACLGENLRRFAAMGGIIAPGSDAGAWAVPHGKGSVDEYDHLDAILGPGSREILNRGTEAVMQRF